MHLFSNSLYFEIDNKGIIFGEPSEKFELLLISSLLVIIILFPFFPLLKESFKDFPNLLNFFLPLKLSPL